MKRNRILAILCATMLLAGCGSKGKQPATSSSTSNGGTHSQAESVTPSTYTYTDAEKALLQKNCPPLADSQSYLASLKQTTSYPELEMVPFEKARKRYDALPQPELTPQYGLITQLPLDTETLYQRVKQNTDEKFSSGKLTGRSKLSEEDMRICCESICKALNRELQNGDYSDHLDDIDSILANLFMTAGKGTANAAITEEGGMEFSRALCQNMVTLTGYEEAMDITIAHETEHIMQKVSVENLSEMGLTYAYGFMPRFDDMEIQPLFFNWYIEAAAERLAVNLYGRDPMTYKTQVGYLDSFSMVPIVLGYSHDALAHATQQSSIETLFSLFGCKDEADKQEVLTMFYAMEAIQEVPDAYFSAYKKTFNVSGDGEEVISDLRRHLKAPCLQSISQFFFRAMATQIDAGKLSLEDVFFLMGNWEIDLLKHMGGSQKNYPAIYNPFIERYVEMQNALFAQLAPALDMDAAALRTLYLHYYDNIPKGPRLILSQEKEWWQTHTVSCYSSETNNMLNHFFMLNAGEKDTAISVYYESAKQN